MKLWKKYPDEKPKTGSKVVVYNKDKFGNKYIFNDDWNEIRGFYYSNKSVQLWCYEADLIASINKEIL